MKKWTSSAVLIVALALLAAPAGSASAELSVLAANGAGAGMAPRVLSGNSSIAGARADASLRRDQRLSEKPFAVGSSALIVDGSTGRAVNVNARGPARTPCPRTGRCA